MIQRFGVIFSTFNNYTDLHTKYSEDKFAILFPFHVIKSNLTNPFFMKTQNLAYNVSVIVNLNNSNDIELCSYLSTTQLYFNEVTEENVYSISSTLLSLIVKYKNIKFIAKIDDFLLWSKLQVLCNFHPNLFVCPTLSLDATKDEIWKTTSVYSFVITHSHFLADFSLTESHFRLVSLFLLKNCVLFLHSESPNLHDLIDSVKELIVRTPISRHLTIFQNPMETIGVNLSSFAYEVLETDQSKYLLYKKAIHSAISNLIKHKSMDSIVVAVIGAGRGPLVECAMQCGIRNLYIVERNPSAIEFLKSKLDEWMPRVAHIELFGQDIRKLSLPKVDIVVSELLGSIGDNELAPECLYNWKNIIDNQFGVVIPQMYSSVFVPIMSDYLWAKAVNEHKLQQILVIPIDTSIYLSKPQIGLTFNYSLEQNEPSTLYLRKSIVFKSAIDGICHGMGGWFSATLYGDVSFSTSPIDDNSGVFSWFPVFIPFSRPFEVTKDQEIEFIFERKGDLEKVWYEWSIIRPVVLPIQNASGTVCNIKL